MKALLAGYGGIGKNVYYPELQKLGYDTHVLDPLIPGCSYADVSQVNQPYDLAVICTPNFTHRPIAEKLAQTGTKTIFVEKPGLSDKVEWFALIDMYRDTQFHLVKNNLYRANYGKMLEAMSAQEIIGVDITWLNGNRIPSPGSWFTTKKLAYGGVSKDLMPHLFCFAMKIFGFEAISNAKFKQACYQRWDMKSITATDYGQVQPGGVYDVDDTALAAAKVGNVTLKLHASWKEGYDKQSITLFYRDGTTFEWNFGLCPSEAYGTMLTDTENSNEVDLKIHEFLDGFNE